MMPTISGEARILVEQFEADFAMTFGQAISREDALDMLVTYGAEVCFESLKSIADKASSIREPIPWFRAVLEKRPVGKKPQAAPNDSAYATHLRIDNLLREWNHLTQEEYDRRREAWRSGGKFDRPERDRYYPKDVVAARKAREEGLQRWVAIWEPRLAACRTRTERLQVCHEMLEAALTGPPGGNLDVGGALQAQTVPAPADEDLPF